VKASQSALLEKKREAAAKTCGPKCTFTYAQVQQLDRDARAGGEDPPFELLKDIGYACMQFGGDPRVDPLLGMRMECRKLPE